METNPSHNWFPKRNAAFLMAYDPIQELVSFFFFSFFFHESIRFFFFLFPFNSTCHFKKQKSATNTQEDELGFQEFQDLELFDSRLSRNPFCMIQEYQEITQPTTRLKNNKRQTQGMGKKIISDEQYCYSTLDE